MIHTLTTSYLSCQNCGAKVKCDQCETLLEAALMSISGVEKVQLQLSGRRLSVEGNLSLNNLVDAMEEIGLFVD